jgi:2-polyprenyl-6-methoxyphenol hydroxylase-like FAD-dependent oxidoreductase
VPYLIGQDQTELVLDRAVRSAGIALFDGIEGSLRSDWIVGCEGSNSIVRDAAGIEREGDRNIGVQTIQGDVRVGGSLAVERDRGYSWVLPSGEVLVILPIAIDGRCRVLVATLDDGATTIRHLTICKRSRANS